jgi:hypothetical protein
VIDFIVTGTLLAIVATVPVVVCNGWPRARDHLRAHGVSVRRSRLEAQAVMAEVRANLNRHTDKGGRPYESDVVMCIRTGEYLYARYYRGPNGEHEQWEAPFPGRSAARIKAEAEYMRENGLVFVYDDAGFRQTRPMTAEELNDPQRYRGCIPVKPLGEAG